MVGVLLDERGPAFAIELQWSGRLRADRASMVRPTHLTLDLGALIESQVRFVMHGGLRWMAPVTAWLQLGGGFGMGLDAGRRARPVTAFELVARMGEGPLGFGLVVLRAELRLDGSTAWTALVGGTSR
jgi:hypothetical protein